MPIFRERFETLESVKDNKFHTWLYLLANGYKDEEEMNMLAEMSEGLKNFAQKYNVAINDPNLVRLYRLEQDAIRDEKSHIGFARNEARQEGLAQGRREANIASALGMKNEGISAEVISRITGLSINEIMAL